MMLLVGVQCVLNRFINSLDNIAKIDLIVFDDQCFLFL